MVRHLIEREIKKRLAICRRRQNEPGISMRALAKEYCTSLRVVCDAMTRSIAEWRDLLDEMIPRHVITKVTPRTGSSRRPSPMMREISTTYEADEDPDLDPDPDPDSIID